MKSVPMSLDSFFAKFALLKGNFRNPQIILSDANRRTVFIDGKDWGGGSTLSLFVIQMHVLLDFILVCNTDAII